MTLITGPATQIITVAEAKDHLRVTGNDEDTLISGLISTAASWLDGWSGVMGMAIMPQTWEWAADGFPAGDICLPLGPVVSITSVKYQDGTEQTFTDYTLDAATGRIRADAGWPATDGTMGAVKVRYVAGSGATDTIKMVVKLLVGHWYENREAVGAKMDVLPMAVSMLIAPLRRVGF